MSKTRMIRFTLRENESVDGKLWIEDDYGHRRDIDITVHHPAPDEDWVPACIGGVRFREEPECADCFCRQECRRSG